MPLTGPAHVAVATEQRLTSTVTGESEDGDRPGWPVAVEDGALRLFFPNHERGCRQKALSR